VSASNRQVIAVGIITDCNGDYLIEQRHAKQHLANTWAFPGGKVQPCESPRSALRRELAEELAIQPGKLRWLLDIPWHYGEKQLFLRCYRVENWHGQIKPEEQQALYYQPLTPKNRLQWLKNAPVANAGLINALLLPNIMRITPAVIDTNRWVDEVLARAAPLKQPSLIQLRPQRALAVGVWQALVERLMADGHWVLVNAAAQTEALIEQLDPQSGQLGVHLKQYQLASMPSRVLARWQQSGGLVSAAVHDLASLRLANCLSVDMVTASPVRSTPSHPGVAGAGWPWFAAITKQAVMPVYALGGVGPTDLFCVHRHRGFGVAGIGACWEV